MQSSNQTANNPYTTTLLPSKRPWKLGATVFSLLSIAGGLLVNNHLNPATTTSTVTTIGTGTGSSSKPDKTVTSDAVPYQFGTIELSVTRKAGKISAIDVGQSSATNGREQAFPYLVQYAIKAQGTNFSNLGGATYTTDAFKAALDSTISKLG
ncbi:MAG: FMN-binding protein [Rhodoluna sp.]